MWVRPLSAVGLAAAFGHLSLSLVPPRQRRIHGRMAHVRAHAVRMALGSRATPCVLARRTALFLRHLREPVDLRERVKSGYDRRDDRIARRCESFPTDAGGLAGTQTLVAGGESGSRTLCARQRGGDMTRSKIYASKIDAWLVALSLSCAVAALTSLSTVSHIGSTGLAVLIVLLACTVLGLLAWVLLGTNYRFDGAMLIICSGPFRWRIQVREILSIEQSRNPLSSPALSLDRLCIQYGAPRRIILISPRDRDEFMHEFERRRGR